MLSKGCKWSKTSKKYPSAGNFLKKVSELAKNYLLSALNLYLKQRYCIDNIHFKITSKYKLYNWVDGIG